jgi:sensor histidine kinase YesM
MVTLEQKALQSMMNPHFIFNTLGSIQNYLLQNKSSEAGLYLSQFARLIRLNINSINSNLINLEEEVNRLRIYLDLEKFRMENKFDYKIELDGRIEEDDLFIPSMLIQPYVENSIWHGISPLESKGMIRILFNMHSDHSIRITVEDNGIGMNQSAKYSSRGESHLHLSMEVIRKRLDIIGKKMQVETSLKISECFPGNENPGTKVELVVPFSYESR